ncbi:uncharacterized protein LOC119374141 [Rhipicephalus sanguineus]|uniref:uncharacterized protein LOC119374141 n=1 Tax=Rhipicephalus sanguineus TaxID=34632 RepID=UPI0018942537|nr:uncharacterized protein LOC119374141 [Rhipicephalus sanguineus]
MSSHVQITECFKMKKPKSSPAKAGPASTPKRRSGKSTPSKLGRSTPPNSSNESSPRNVHDESYSQAPVDLDNLIVDELLCSQDVVNSDVIWDCSSPRSRLVPAPGGSDVESLVKLFRTKPQEIKPIPSAFSIIDTNFVKTSGKAPTPRRKKGNGKKAASAASAKAVMDQMQELWDMVQQSKKNGFGLAAAASVSQVSEDTQDAASTKSPGDAAKKVRADTVPQTDTASTVAAAEAPTEESAAIVVVEEEEDYDMWLMGDDSILVAATQEIDVSSPARKCSKTPTRGNRPQLPSVGCGAACITDTNSPAVRKTPPSASPVHRQEGHSTPNWHMGATRKSPRLSMLSVKRTPSPLRASSAKTRKSSELVNHAEPVNPSEVPKRAEPVKTAAPVKTVEPVKAAAPVKTVEPVPAIQSSSRTSSTDLLFDDDDEDELLDQICCTYEQQQQVDAKTAAGASASSSKTSTLSTVTPTRSTTLTSHSVTVVSSIASKSSTTLSSKAETPKAMVIKSCLSATSVRQVDQPKGGPKNVPIPARPSSSLRATVSVSALNQSSNSTTKPGFSALSNTTNQPKPGSTHTGSFQQPRVMLERCVATSVKAPPHGKGPSSSSAPVSTASKPCLSTKSPSERPSLGTVRPQSALVKTLSRSTDAALDFDDDDSDLATPEVMSWLEEVESQPVQVKRCTPEEIAKKRAEALRRRRLREQESNKWKGRLRMSK